MAFRSLFFLLLLSSLAAALRSTSSRHLHRKARSHDVWHRDTGARLPPLNTTYFFDQLVDHDDPSLGTFKQRYWFGYQYYKSGGPIILYNNGESDASGSTIFLTNESITGAMAEKFNGAVVIIEHRFFGESNPFPDLSTKSFRVHTLEQSIADLEYFAKNVQLPMPGGDEVAAPDKAPWIVTGGSYSGALTSYTMHRKPGLFYAGYATSAVVQAIGDFWRYFEPIREAMPKNCSADVQAAIAYIDDVISSGNATNIRMTKQLFGIGESSHDDDFVNFLTDYLHLWQDLNPASGPGGDFYKFCDALEVKDDGKIAGPEGWGVDHALPAWGNLATGDSGNGTFDALYGTYNASVPRYTNLTINNGDRSWKWLLCTEFGFWFDGAPEGYPTLVSRHLTTTYSERDCANYFPEAFNNSRPSSILNALDVNKRYGGWNTTTERLIFVSGTRDPWREATPGATGVIDFGSDLQPHLLADGFHGSDALMENGLVSESIAAAQNATLGYLGKWLAGWKPSA